jgi:hypothetical protein
MKGPALCRFVGRRPLSDATFGHIDRRREQNVARWRTQRAAARRRNPPSLAEIGDRRRKTNRHQICRPTRKMNCEEQQPRRNRSVISRQGDHTFFLSALDDRPKQAYSMDTGLPEPVDGGRISAVRQLVDAARAA